MILDGLGQVNCTAPTSGNFFSLSSSSIDLMSNSSFASGGALVDMKQIVARFLVTEAFAGTTLPAANLHVVAAVTADLFTTGSTILATAGGPIAIFTARLYAAFTMAQLPLGATVDIVVPPLNASLYGGLDLRTLRYIGCAITVPNYADAGPPAVTSGKVECSFLLTPSQPALHRLFPTGMVVR